MRGKYQRENPGQSLPLLALMIVVIIGMVGLSVDVGNTYGQQRRMQNVANAAALAGMSSVLSGRTNEVVWNNIKSTLVGNRVDVAGPEFSFRADYVIKNQVNPAWLGFWEGTTKTERVQKIINGSDKPPQNILRIQVTIEERVDTYFARVLGRPTLPAAADGNACPGGYDIGVYPMGIPFYLTRDYHKVFRSDGSLLSQSDPKWGSWEDMKGMGIYLPVENWSDGMSGTHISWLNWNSVKNSNGASALDYSMTYPGDLQNGFREAPAADSNLPTNAPNGRLDELDWVDGDTGVKAQLSDDLQALLSPSGSSSGQPRILTLPMYQGAGKVDNTTSFRMVQFGKFQVLGFDLNQPSGTIPPSVAANKKYIYVRYLGKGTPGAGECASEWNPDGKRFRIEGLTNLNYVYRKPISNVTYDVMLVMDTSGSMAYDWNDRGPGQTGYDSSNQRIVAAQQAITRFAQNWSLADDPDARMALITFGGSGNNAVVQKTTWKTACLDVTNDCGGKENKWSDIQTQASKMTPGGNTPGPMALEKVLSLLQNPGTTRNGKTVKSIVLFATDSVFNVCASSSTYGGNARCDARQDVYCEPGLDPAFCLNNPEYNLVNGRPLWQGQQIASTIKSNKQASIYMVALTPSCNGSSQYCFNPRGLPDMSSGSSYYYTANSNSAIQNVYDTIESTIKNANCQPLSNTVPARGATMRLTQPQNPTFRAATTTGTDGRFTFEGLEAGQYVLKADSITFMSPEDLKTRTYARVQNAFNLSEETQASVSIDLMAPNGSAEPAELLVSIGVDKNGVPLNGCNTP